MLTEWQREQYRRQTMLRELGEKGQRKLLDAKALIIGCGGLGSPAALYLAAMGLGTLGLVDSDKVELTNLHRQILFTEEDLDRSKAELAAYRLRRQNKDLTFQPHPVRVTADNIAELIAGYGLVLECADNFATKQLISDACVAAGKPFIHGSTSGWTGEVLCWQPGFACYRCVFPAAPPEEMVPPAGRTGVLGSLAGIVGTLQATEAVKIITGAGTPLFNRLLRFNALTHDWQVVAVKPDPACPCQK